jgi:uncharacterized membrane protein YcaP (DUF421 family)
METIYQLFGEGKELTALQVTVRSVAIFFIALVMIRLRGLRMFSMKTPFDIIVAIMMGAILSRAVLGLSPFITCCLSVAVLLIIHSIFSFACRKSPFIAKLVKGRSILLFENGAFNHDNLSSASLTERDITESLRLNTQHNSFDKVDKVYLESNGRVSFVFKEKNKDAEKIDKPGSRTRGEYRKVKWAGRAK